MAGGRGRAGGTPKASPCRVFLVFFFFFFRGVVSALFSPSFFSFRFSLGFFLLSTINSPKTFRHLVPGANQHRSELGECRAPFLCVSLPWWYIL